MNQITLNATYRMAIGDSTLIVLGKVKQATLIPQVFKMCRGEGFLEIKVKYVGGLWVWFQFDSSNACNNLKSNEGVQKYVGGLWVLVSKKFVLDERALWMEIRGISLNNWSLAAFKKSMKCMAMFICG